MNIELIMILISFQLLVCNLMLIITYLVHTYKRCTCINNEVKYWFRILDDHLFLVSWDLMHWDIGLGSLQHVFCPYIWSPTLTWYTQRWLWKISSERVGSTKAACRLWCRVTGFIPTSYAPSLWVSNDF